ncbi:transposase [Labilibaculum antarcticum]|uniref:transposase n=1 Tax=Labilibaculum antarcticum TaxID=1717717 RepID=UPI000BBA8E8B|nr:transposase [Labilibaculum antarcticum]
MDGKFQNKYRIPSARLKDWDYGSNAIYFVTICTQHRQHYFGEISNGKMRLNEIGELAASEWLKTPGIRPDMNLELGEFVIMPNHFHALITIGKNNYNTHTDAMHRVSTGCTLPLHRMHRISNDFCTDAMHRVSTNAKFGSQSKNLASIIRGFKSSVTINARKINSEFTWQSRFHDHIVRDFDSFHRIEQYIQNNPCKWIEDLYLIYITTSNNR